MLSISLLFHPGDPLSLLSVGREIVSRLFPGFLQGGNGLIQLFVEYSCPDGIGPL